MREAAEAVKFVSHVEVEPLVWWEDAYEAGLEHPGGRLGSCPAALWPTLLYNPQCTQPTLKQGWKGALLETLK